MKYTLLVTCLIVLVAFTAFAQITAEVPKLDSDRPNYTQGATVIPHKTIQIETGLEFRNDKSFNKQERTFLYPTTLVRLGILKKAELRVNFDLEQEKKKTLTGSIFPGAEAKEKGFDNVQIGTKIALFEGQGAVPEIALLAHATLPVGNKEFRPPHVAPGGQLLFDSKLTEKLELQCNIGYRKHKSENDYGGELLYSASAILNVTTTLLAFAEYQALKPVHQSPENSVAGGFLYQLLPNLQLDVLGGIGVSEAAPDLYTGAGVTWRVPR